MPPCISWPAIAWVAVTAIKPLYKVHEGPRGGGGGTAGPQRGSLPAEMSSDDCGDYWLTSGGTTPTAPAAFNAYIPGCTPDISARRSDPYMVTN